MKPILIYAIGFVMFFAGVGLIFGPRVSGGLLAIAGLLFMVHAQMQEQEQRKIERAKRGEG